MAYRKISKAAFGYTLAFAMSMGAASAFAAGSSNNAGGAGSSHGGVSNASHATKGLANAYANSNNPVVNVENCLHSSGCTMTLTGTTTTYTSMGQIARAAEQAGLSLSAFISTDLTITY